MIGSSAGRARACAARRELGHAAVAGERDAQLRALARDRQAAEREVVGDGGVERRTCRSACRRCRRSSARCGETRRRGAVKSPPRPASVGQLRRRGSSAPSSDERRERCKRGGCRAPARRSGGRTRPCRSPTCLLRDGAEVLPVYVNAPFGAASSGCRTRRRASGPRRRQALLRDVVDRRRCRRRRRERRRARARRRRAQARPSRTGSGTCGPFVGSARFAAGRLGGSRPPRSALSTAPPWSGLGRRLGRPWPRRQGLARGDLPGHRSGVAAVGRAPRRRSR